MSRNEFDPHQYANHQQDTAYPPYASTEQFSTQDFVGQDSSGRRDQYPPTRGGDGSSQGHSATYGSGDYTYEKGTNPISRGSIAAQMAAEGQIPKKEGLRMWRADEHAGALTRGGKGRACGRICCCSIILVIIILVSIIAAFLLWTRPPDVTFNGVEAPANGSEVTVQSNGFLLNFQLNIGVVNPNCAPRSSVFGVNFDEITATGAYSTAPTQNLGGGTLKHVDIPKNSNTTIHFPFTINYTLADDPSLSIAKSIVGKCGLLGGTKSDLTIDYTVSLKLKVVAVTINPSFSSSTSFACPLSESDLSGIVSSIGGSLSGRSLDDGPVLDERDWASHVASLPWDRRREVQDHLERAVIHVMRSGMASAAQSWEDTSRRWR